MPGIYDTMVQLKAIELLPIIPSFLHDATVIDGGNVTEEEALWDFKKGTVKMAPFVAPNVGGVVIEREGYRTNRIEFPMIAPERPVQKTDLTTRAFGEQIYYGGMTPEERARKLTMADIVDMRNMIQLRREWMVSQLLATGKLDIYEYTEQGVPTLPTKQVDYGFTNNFVPDYDWDEEGSDPDEDMYKMEELVLQGQGKIGYYVMSQDVAGALLHNKNYIAQHDIRNANFGKLEQRFVDPHVRYIGVNARGVEMYEYTGTFEDEQGNTKNFIPNGTIELISDGLFKEYHGPITQLEGSDFRTYIAREVPKVYSNERNDVKNQRLASRPMYIPFNVDAWAVGKVK